VLLFNICENSTISSSLDHLAYWIQCWFVDAPVPAQKPKYVEFSPTIGLCGIINGVGDPLNSPYSFP